MKHKLFNMFKNYLKSAWRNLIRNTTFSLINILGLALGITCSLLILLWVQDERSIDGFHKNNKLLYSIYEKVSYDGQVENGYYTPGLMADEIKKSIPEIQYAAGFDWTEQTATFQVDEKIIHMVGGFAGADFFKMFSYQLLEGTPESALDKPGTIAISRRMAENFFGSPAAAIGKAIRYDNRINLLVTGVYENLPSNASEKFDFLINWRVMLESIDWLNQWIYSRPHTFIQLRPEANPAFVEAKIKHFLDAYNKEQTKSFFIELGMQRFDQIYLHSNFKNGKPAGGRIEYVQLFSAVAIFILLIACINFMNLSTARSAKRAKEVGVRKVSGASRFMLIGQFVGEAILTTFFAIVIALIAVAILLPMFNHLTGKQIVLPLSSFSFWATILGLLALTGFVAGSYPALFMSSLNPIMVLKGMPKFNTGIILFRKGLVVFQFSLSIALIIGTIVVSNQVKYIQSANLGFNKENLLYIPFEGDMAQNYSLLKQELSQMPGIKNVTRISNPPISITSQSYDLNWEGKNPNIKTIVIHVAVGYDFIKTMNLQLLQGHDFSKDYPADSNGYIINETALRLIGYKNPIGQPLTLFHGSGKIIGVVKDFHYNSLRQPIRPLVIRFGENISWGNTLVRTEPGKTKEAIASLEKVCKQLNPKFPFTYYFSDEEYQKLYNNEEVVSSLSDSFAILAIFISCLGLLGLIMFTAEQRTKEIGIRKVLGASVTNIVGMLSKDFLKLVIISALIAFPVSWWAMNTWLQEYAYRIDISWWIFIAAALSAITIAMITISFQAIKAGMANPVKSLRTE